MTVHPLAAAPSRDLLDVLAAAQRTRGLPPVLPWQFVVGWDQVELWAGEAKRADDRLTHLLAGSSTAAAVATAHARGCALDVELLPDQANPELWARWSLRPGHQPTIDDVQLAVAVELTGGRSAGGGRRLVPQLVARMLADSREVGVAAQRAGLTGLVIGTPADGPVDWLRAGWATGVARLRAASWGASIAVSYDAGAVTLTAFVPQSLIRVG